MKESGGFYSVVRTFLQQNKIRHRRIQNKFVLYYDSVSLDKLIWLSHIARQFFKEPKYEFGLNSVVVEFV